MSPETEQLTDFERATRAALEDSVSRLDGRIRSRLNQARQAAVAEAAQGRAVPLRRGLTLMPAAGAVAAALLVAMVFWHRQPQTELPVAEAPHMTVEDLDLLADGEGLELMEGGDNSFYEWAADQSEGTAETDS